MAYTRDEVYDWLADTQEPEPARPVARRADALAVNPVTGHGRDCECSRCPGWYNRRGELAAGGVADPRPTRPNVLFDQVIPVCCLLAMVTVCGLVLLPVIVPLLAISAMMVVALALVLVAGAVAVVYAVNAVKRASEPTAGRTIRGQVVSRRGRWR